MLDNFEKEMKEYQQLQEHLARAQVDALRGLQKRVNSMFDDELSHLQRVLAELSGTEPKLPGDGTFTAELTAAVHAMLLEERPLHRNAIHQRLQAQDIHVGGKDSLGTLSAYLSNDKRFITAGRGEWTLAKSPAMEHTENAFVITSVSSSRPTAFADTLRQYARDHDGKLDFGQVNALIDQHGWGDFNIDDIDMEAEIWHWLVSNSEWELGDGSVFRLRAHAVVVW